MILCGFHLSYRSRGRLNYISIARLIHFNLQMQTYQSCKFDLYRFLIILDYCIFTLLTHLQKYLQSNRNQLMFPGDGRIRTKSCHKENMEEPRDQLYSIQSHERKEWLLSLWSTSIRQVSFEKITIKGCKAINIMCMIFKIPDICKYMY